MAVFELEPDPQQSLIDEQGMEAGFGQHSGAPLMGKGWEEDAGVFKDLVTRMKQMAEANPPDLLFGVCGSGSRLNPGTSGLECPDATCQIILRLKNGIAVSNPPEKVLPAWEEGSLWIPERRSDGRHLFLAARYEPTEHSANGLAEGDQRA